MRTHWPLHIGIHPGCKLIFRIRYVELHRHGPSFLIERIRDPRDESRKAAVRVCRNMERDSVTSPNAGVIRLGNSDHQPQMTYLFELHEGLRPWSGECARMQVAFRDNTRERSLNV